MKIYLDLILLLNLFLDFIILILVSFLLKRRVRFLKLLLGAVVGSISTLFLFLPLSSLSLFLLKVVLSILIVITTFSYKDGKYFFTNFIYFYVISIMLGGIIYFLNNTFGYKNYELSINFFLLIIIAIIILFLYVKQIKSYKNNYSLIHKVELIIGKNKYIYNGYLDTGNKLVDPYKKRSIILVYDKKLNFDYSDSILVPYKTLDNNGVIKCRKIDKIIIDDKVVNIKVLVGLSKSKFNIEGIECILPNIIKEDLI